MVLSAGVSFAQTKPPTKTTGQQSQTKKATAANTAKSRKPLRKLTPQKQFVEDVVRMAVALPQPDPQDRLRVLSAAVNISGPVSAAMARKYADEGAKIEADLIAAGEKPVTSVLSAGYFDCAGTVPFIDRIPATAVAGAEQSLINLMSTCPKQATEPVRQKLETALDQGDLAPRALLAMMDKMGAKSAWSQTNFAKMFGALPSDAEKDRMEAPNYAAMFNRMAPELDKDVVRDAGIRFLDWLGKMSPGNERNLAVNMTVDTLKQALGQEAYDDAMRQHLVARDVASTAGQPGEVEHPAEENVSVLAAMGEVGQDQTDALSKMPVSLRAREAAAHGFASGTSGHPKDADHYFDIAFSAVDDVWNDRSDQKDAPAVVQEVCEAAAQVNAVSALKRAQGLGDPSEQAIGMLAVARVVLGQSDTGTDSAHPPAAGQKSGGHPIRN